MRKLIRVATSSLAGLVRATVLMTLAAVVVAFAIGGVASAAAPKLSADQSDYTPESLVHVTGTGFAPGTYAVPVLRPDGSMVTGDGTFTPGWDEVTTGGSGNLAYGYQLDGVLGFYEVRAYPSPWSGDWSETPIATLIFHDGPEAANLDQCRNGTFAIPVQCTGAAWHNGNANADTAHWREGDSIPYRMRFSGMPTTGDHTVTIEWDTTKNGKHALDYLTSFDRTEATGDPCSGVAGCGSPSTFPIPVDPNVTGGGVTPDAGVFTCFNCTISAVSPYTLTGTYAGTSSTRVTITFSAATANPVLAWGGHIASQFDWGSGRAASSISGSPYHTSLVDLDGSGGNQDRGLQSAAVVGPPTIATDVSSSSISPGHSVTDHAALSGGNGAVTGTVLFFVCGPAASAPDCTTGGTQIGTAVTILGEEATSDPFTPGTDPSAAGTYCFRAEYTPDASAQYSIGKHTDTTLECFEQLTAGINIAKVADDPVVTPTDPIGFLITVTNGGTGTAEAVEVNDPLPEGTGLSWSIDGGTGAGLCSITPGSPDTLTCTFGDMGPGDSYTVHISSPTNKDSMGIYTNTADVTSTNAGSDEATATIHVPCTDTRLAVKPDADTVNQGDPAGFIITATAKGSTVRDLVVTIDFLPAGLTWTIDQANSNQGCTISSGVVTCSWGDLAKKKTRRVHVVSSATQALGKVRARATATSSTAHDATAHGILYVV